MQGYHLASDLSRLKDILENQAERGISSGDWTRLESELRETPTGYELVISSMCIGFAFSSRGRLLGMFNWKE